MLISYPILPAPTAATPEDELTAFIQAYVHPGTGTFPVSRRNRWHGGVHLAPGNAPIRAIADAEVVAYRAAATETYKGAGNYDTSFVLLKHSTEAGEHTPVVFYSLYMHLQSKSKLTAAQLAQLPSFLRHAPTSTAVVAGGGQKLWRKDVLGFGGELYQHAGRCVHFEVFAQEADFQHIWKDSAAVSQGGEGSADFFGDAGFVIPAGSSFIARHPHADAQHRLNLGGNSHYGGADKLPLGQAGSSTDELCVSVRLHHGKRTATTWRKRPDGDYEQLGVPVTQVDYEYELFRLASHLYTDCPSAGYEWLRFGRVLGPDSTTHNENWQLIRYSQNSIGYIDLAAASNRVSKLSDADFPHWQGWKKIDEGDDALPEDGLCDVPALQVLLHIPSNVKHKSLSESPDFASQISDPAIASKLRHLTCKFRSEWDDSQLDDPATNPYQRLRQPGQPLADPQAWQRFRDHVRKLAFWSTAGLTGKAWHFHPLQFVKHFSKCKWLTTMELEQLMPMHVIRESGSSYFWEHPVLGQAARNTISNCRIELNNALLKYCFHSPMRLAAFFGNAMQETAWLSKLYENNPGATYYPWDGRGFLQLTIPSGNTSNPNNNYFKYWKFLGRDPEHSTNLIIAAWRQEVALPYDASQSAGAYWIWPGKWSNSQGQSVNNSHKYADMESPFVRVNATTNHGTKSYYTHEGFRRAAASVNRPGSVYSGTSFNGMSERYCAYVSSRMIFDDILTFPVVTGHSEIPADYKARRS